MENAVQSEVRTLKQSSQKDSKLRTLCLDIFKARLAEQEAKRRYAELQAKLQTYFNKSGDKGLQFPYKGKIYKIVGVKPKTMVWDVDRLINKIKATKDNSDDLLSQIIETKVVISNVSEFKKLLKDNGIKFKDIQPFLSVEKKVIGKKINELSEIGEITMDDIEGCYTMKDSQGYLLPSESEIEEDE